MILKHFQVLNTLDHIVHRRKGEIKLGERLRLLDLKSQESLEKHKKAGARFALLGIPESVGILANHGNGGAENSWEQFLWYFTNQQSNRYFEGSNILCLGQVETRDLQLRSAELDPKDSQYFTKLRSLCQELDQRVTPVVEEIGKAGLIPIIIGGGHNNSYPILRGLTKGLGALQGISCINIDAHADFRPLEGRHSGNGFSYAFYAGYLSHYYVLGLNESANSEAMLKNMDLEAGVSYQTYQPGEEVNISGAIDFVKDAGNPVGLEVDLDALAFIPTSAFAVSGYSIDQVRILIRTANTQISPAYLHLTEGQATDKHRDAQVIGKTLSTLVLEFIKSYPG